MLHNTSDTCNAYERQAVPLADSLWPGKAQTPKSALHRQYTCSTPALHLHHTCIATLRHVRVRRYCTVQELPASEVEDAELQEAIARSLKQDQPGSDRHTSPCNVCCFLPSRHCCGLVLPSTALYKPPESLLLLLLHLKLDAVRFLGWCNSCGHAELTEPNRP